MMENRSFDHLLDSGDHGKDARTGAATKAEDLIGPGGSTIDEPYNEFAELRYTVSPTAGDQTYNKHDVKHQFPDVLTQLCGQAEGRAVIANGGLKGGAYPPVAAATKTGFAADYALNSDLKNPGEPMRCFARGTLPVLTALAKEFVLCDHWFSSMAGPTSQTGCLPTPRRREDGTIHLRTVTMKRYTELNPRATPVTASLLRMAPSSMRCARRTSRFASTPATASRRSACSLGISLYSDVDDFENFVGDVSDPTYDAAYTFLEPRYDTISQNLGLPFVNNSQHPANSRGA